MLFNEPKLLKCILPRTIRFYAATVSVLFNEPKLLKYGAPLVNAPLILGFSALQRAEIAEMFADEMRAEVGVGFSALQRAEIAEIPSHPYRD